MKLLNINSIKKTLISLEHLRDLRYLKGLSNDELVNSMYAFSYGLIVGKQQERARRNGLKYKKAVLVDDSVFDLCKITCEAVKGISAEDLDEFFNHMKDYVTTKMSESAQGKVLGLLEAIKRIEMQKRSH